MSTTTSRDKYVAEAKKQLDEWNAQLDQLEERIGKARETGSEELEREMRRAREVYDQARASVEELVLTADDAAEKIEAETRHFMTVLERSIRYFRSQL